MSRGNAGFPGQPETTLQRCISPSLTEVDGLCAELRAGVLGRIPTSERFVVELLLREALTNAVLHGAKLCADGTVRCHIEHLPGGITMRISDSGAGFDWRRALYAAGVSLAESGRGIQILRQYASALRFNEKGNCVEVTRMFGQGGQGGKF